jgi:hypothetical protein
MAYAFFGLLLYFIVLDLIWWRAADRRMRGLRRALFWRTILAAFMATMVGYLICSRLFLRALGQSEWRLPGLKVLLECLGMDGPGLQGDVTVAFHALVYLWHFLILPPALIALGIAAIWRRIVQRIARVKARANLTGRASPSVAAMVAPAVGTPRAAPTRRQMLGAAGIMLPPLASVAAAAGTVRTLYGRRLRHFDVTLSTLPRELDGMTLVHISDTHIGKFLHHDRLPAIADDVNKLDADFIVFTGDLIDMSLDDLTHGINFLRSLKSRCGQAICEGNHDLLQNGSVFQSRMRNAGLPLMVGDQSLLRYTSRSGASYPVQFIGVPWTTSDDERSLAVQVVLPIARPDAFRILLAHHPHSFDAAANAGFPLVLSGHTHGGQLNFNEHVGVGSLRFKYISGHYTKPGSSLIVNNGLGNWFPLRINAPAEIVHITLNRGGEG